MGLGMSRMMDENLKKQQEFMLLTQRLQLQDSPQICGRFHQDHQLELERQLAMQNLMRERQMAMQLATARQTFTYFSAFFIITTLGLAAGSIRRKQPRLLVPVIPLTFVLAYQYDFAYGHFIQRARHEAENILDSNVELVAMPGGVPGFDELEKARRAQSKLAVLSLDVQR